jgi:hypothetical protein
VTETINFNDYLGRLHAIGLIPGREEYPEYAQFSAWSTFKEAPDLDIEKWKLGAFCGVYLVAVFPEGKQPLGPADPFRQEDLPFVVYVGRTETRSLRGRWSDLERAVATGSGHSGGNTLWKAFKETLRGQDSLAESLTSHVRISGLPVWVSSARREPGGFEMDRRQTCFRTAAIEAALIEAISDRKRVRGLPPMANDPKLTEPGERFLLVPDPGSA